PIAAPEEPKWFVGGEATEDGRYLLVHFGRGDSDDTLVSYAEMGDPQAPNPAAPLVKLIDRWEAQFSMIGDDGATLFAVTNLHAPKRRIVAIDTRKPERANWKEIVPEGADTIESARIIGGKIIVQKMHDAANRLSVYAKDGTAEGEIELPGLGSVSGFTGR